MKRERIKGFISGVIATTVVLGITLSAWAATGQQSITVGYNNIKVYIDNVLTEMKDPNGKTVEPFIYDGTTYVPLRAVSEALNKEVVWDNNTKSIYIGAQPAPSSSITEEDALNIAYSKALSESPEMDGYLSRIDILDQNADAYLVEICFDLEDWVRIYWVDKKNGNVKFVTGAQDYWTGMIDFSTGTLVQTEYVE